MELYQLRGFATVAELGHLTRAAEKLHISQPALSAQIKALEDELSVLLFERSASGMTLTAAGKRLPPEAVTVIEAAAALRGNAHAFQGEVAGHVRLGMLSDPDFVRLGDFLAQATARFPLLEIELHHEVSGTAGELCVWPEARLATTLQFICPREHGEEPETRALLDVIGDVWREPPARAGGANNARRSRARATVDRPPAKKKAGGSPRRPREG